MKKVFYLFTAFILFNLIYTSPIFADEYYFARHKTCRNFDDVTKAYIHQVPFLSAPVIEFGAGKGRTQEYLGIPANVHIDSSVKMLQLQPREPGLPILAEATCVPIIDEYFCTATAFLCDPFLSSAFLGEAYRLLKSKGILILTTPSYEWARTVRGGEHHDTTFVTEDKGRVTVPSNMYDRTTIYQMVILSGFVVELCRPCFLQADQVPSEAAKEAVEKGLPLIYLLVAHKP